MKTTKKRSQSKSSITKSDSRSTKKSRIIKQNRETNIPTITILISGHGEVLKDRIDHDIRENTYNFNPMPIATCIIVEFADNLDILSIKKISDLYEFRENDIQLSHSKILKNFCYEFTEFYKEQLTQRLLKNNKRLNYFIKKYLNDQLPLSSKKISLDENTEYYISALKSLYNNNLIKEEDEDEYDDLIDYYNIEIGLTSEKHAKKMQCKFQNLKRDKTLNLEQYKKYKTYTGITIIDNTNPELIDPFTEEYVFSTTNFSKEFKNIYKSANKQKYKKLRHTLIPSENGEINRNIIKYSELILFLKELGYKNIYVYDMTCNAEEDRNIGSVESIMSSIGTDSSSY